MVVGSGYGKIIFVCLSLRNSTTGKFSEVFLLIKLGIFQGDSFEWLWKDNICLFEFEKFYYRKTFLNFST
ncbi:hypothetical protein, partial [Okeania sp.]|uniref:hypothetical protein n=1 Tax=Okeania sp. TaxID=3100323 RepID=UPI002B4AB1E0